MHSQRMSGWILILTSLLCVGALAQDESHRPNGRWTDQPHVVGQITSINGDVIEVLMPDNKTASVKITSGTQFRKNRDQAKLADFKVGDMIMALGEQQKDGSILARMVAGGFPGGGPQGRQMGMAGMSREDLGKKFIMGEVKKIDETKLTILRPDNVEQVVEVDENTSFRNDKNESVTLADIKVGDHVGGRGELKNGAFVPQVLRIGLAPRQRSEHNPTSQSDQKPQAEQK